MADFQAYSAEAVIASNLQETATRLEAVCEQECAHIAELAAEILSDSRQTSDFVASLSEHKPPMHAIATNASHHNSEALEGFAFTRHVWQTVQLCKALRTGWQLAKHDVPEFFFPEPEIPSPEAKGRMIFQRTKYADEAFRVFSTSLEHAHPLYTHSVAMACEEVERGNCEYCILPLENSAEGMLNGFSRLIEQHGLKIADICDLPTQDGTRTTRFALLRRTLFPLRNGVDRETLLECVIPLEEDTADVSAWLLAAHLCGLTLARIVWKSAVKNDGFCPAVHAVFSVGNGDLCAYLLYLFMEAPHYEPLGLYRQPKFTRKGISI